MKIKSGQVDEKIDTRIMEMSLDGKTAITPSKSIEKLMPKGLINEFAPQFSKDNLCLYMKSGRRQGTISKSSAGTLSQLNKNIVDSAINVMIPNYVDVELNKEEREAMESLQHENTDIIVIPRWQGILKTGGSETIDLIKKQTQDYVEEIASSNSKPIFGNIPIILSINEMKTLIEHYYDLDITSFVIDYCNHAAHTSAPNVRYVKKKLKKDGFLDDSLLYSVNVRKVAPAGVSYTPADDFLVFGQGIDIIGSLHLGGGGNEKPAFPTTSVFKSETYTYDRVRIVESERNRKRATNYVKQNMETEKIVATIRENGTAYNFLNGKMGAQPIEKLIDTGVTPTFLEDFF